MIVGPKAADWENGKNADQARQLMSAHGGSDYDIEEARCLLMQAKLSILSGAMAKDYLTSRDFIAATP